MLKQDEIDKILAISSREININLLIANISRKELYIKFNTKASGVTDALAGRVLELRYNIINYIKEKRKGDWYSLPVEEQDIIVRRKKKNATCLTGYDYAVMSRDKQEWKICCYRTFRSHIRKGWLGKRRKKGQLWEIYYE